MFAGHPSRDLLAPRFNKIGFYETPYGKGKRVADRIVSLSSSDAQIPDLGENVRGWRVVDRTEAALGTVDDLFVDGQGRPHFVLVKVEGGSDARRVVVPANAARLMSNDTLLVNEFRDHILDAPPGL